MSFYIPDVKKILVLRSGALGDLIVILPALNAIKKKYPAAELVLLGSPWMSTFLPERIVVDRFIEVPVCKGIREEKGVEENAQELEFFFEQIQKERFDVAIQFQGKGVAANPFIKRLGARVTVGLTCPEAEDPDRFTPFYYYQSETLRYLEVAGLIGANLGEIEPRAEVLYEDYEELLSEFPELNVEPFVVLHPCSLDIRRSWPFEKFPMLGDLLAGEGIKVVFSGSAKDSEVIKAIISQMKLPALDTSGKLSLGGLSALLNKSQLTISSDTGPLHLARAVGTNTVGIYWAPNLINWGPLTRKNHRPVVSWKMECPMCGIVPNSPYPFEPQGVTCNHNISFVREVKVEEVFAEAKELLKIFKYQPAY